MLKFEVIETARMILKGIYPEGMNFIFENYTKDEIKKILGHRTEDDFQKEENKYKNGYASYNRKFIQFLMTDKSSDKIIGRSGFHNWNEEHRRAEIGYALYDDLYKNKGLMTEALREIIDYGFKKMNLNRIEALVGTENTPSLKIMEKFGFKKEGLLRQHYYVEGKFEDSAIFSKLVIEYNSK